MAEIKGNSVKQFKTITLVSALLLVLLICSCGSAPSDNTLSTSGDHSSSSSNNSDEIAKLYSSKKSDVQVQGKGTVSKLLSDDTNGDQHQRFILKLDNGHTLLVTHNIDLAPRLDGLAVGDMIEFYGEYYYNEQGGGIHWTHHDPDKKHIGGWLLWNGTYFE